MPTKSDYDALRARTSEHPAVRDARAHLRGEFRRAAVDAANLSGIPEWDTFCTYVQAQLDQFAIANEALTRRMVAETLHDPAEILALRQAIVGNNIRIETLLHVVRFPLDVLAANDKLAGEQAANLQEAMNG